MHIGQPLDYVVQHYRVPAAIGRRVIAYGKPGIIVKDCGHHIGIALDEDPKRRVGHYHPVDGIEYGEMADKLPKRPKRTNWDRYRDDEHPGEFHEYLCINRPHREQRKTNGKRQYRMYRTDNGYSFGWREIQGDWHDTAAQAKASYKDALKARRAADKAERA